MDGYGVWPRRIVLASLLGLSLSSAGLSGLLLGTQASEERAFHGKLAELVEQTDRTSADRGKERSRDWDALLNRTPPVIAWLTVRNTPISYPVVQATSDRHLQWLLSHDPWGERHAFGTLSVDHRTMPDRPHVLIYGHHISGSSVMFSSLQRCWQPLRFERLGHAILETPQSAGTYTPAMAMRIDETYGTLQRFESESSTWIGPWMEQLKQETHPRAVKTTHNRDAIRQVLTLITCAQERSGQAERTAVLFVRS